MERENYIIKSFRTWTLFLILLESLGWDDKTLSTQEAVTNVYWMLVCKPYKRSHFKHLNIVRDSNIKMDLRETLSGKGERDVCGPDWTGSEHNKEPPQSPKAGMEFLDQLSK